MKKPYVKPFFKNTEDEHEFTSMKVNIPKNLVEEFTRVAQLNHYSRVEAMKEAMRQFIMDQTPDNYASPKDWENMWRGMLDGILAVSEDPKYKELGIDPKELANSQAAQMSPKSSASAFAVDSSASGFADGETL